MNDEQEQKQKQIEGMAKEMCEEYGTYICKNECQLCGDCANEYIAENLYAAGYRKQSEVIDEFVERLKEENEISLRRYGKGIGMTAIFKIADEMKFELFKQQEDNNG